MSFAAPTNGTAISAPTTPPAATPISAAAHDVIASTKPGYRPSPSASPTEPEVEVATVTAQEPVALPPRITAVQGSPVPLPDERALRDLIKLGIGVALLGIAIAAVAAAESRWSRRHFA